MMLIIIFRQFFKNCLEVVFEFSEALDFDVADFEWIHLLLENGKVLKGYIF
jgi:hypothetical protein